MVTTRRLLVGEPAWVLPTAAGLRACGSSFGVWQPRIGLLAHVAAVNDVRLHVQGRSPLAEWVCERTLARERAAGEHLPDGVVLVDGQRVAIEVELTVKSRRRVTAILDELERRFDAVVYFCAPGAAPPARASSPRSGRWPSLDVRELPDRPAPRRSRDDRGLSVAGVLRTPQAVRRVATVSGSSRLSCSDAASTARRGSRSRDASPVSARCPSTAASCCSPRSGCAGICSCAARRARARPRPCCASPTRSRSASDAPVFYLDGKGDRETAARFVGLMADAGRGTRVFPNEPFDGWRGAPHEIHGRLMEVIDYASDGPAVVVSRRREERAAAGL